MSKKSFIKNVIILYFFVLTHLSIRIVQSSKFSESTCLKSFFVKTIPYSSFALEQYVMEATRTDIYGSKQLRLVICDCANGKAVGFIDLFNFSPRDFRAEVGVLIERNSRNKGYAGEALELLIDYAFNTLHVHQLACTLTAENTISRRLFEKAGFVHTSTRKEWFFRNNKWEDELVYQLLK